jgi:hypothetical protein
MILLLPAAFKLPYVATQFDIADHGYWTKPDIGLKRVDIRYIIYYIGQVLEKTISDIQYQAVQR